MKSINDWDGKNLSIDHLFAQKLLPEGDPLAKTFLANLLKSAREGHLCLPINSETEKGVSLLPPSLFDEHLVRDKQAIYLRRNWECEQQFIRHVERIRHDQPVPQLSLENWNPDKLNAEQKEAVIKAASQTLTLITGGPGSGKTFTAAILIQTFINMGIKEVAVAAPTGKAASNLRLALNSTECTVKTLHSLLKEETLYADLIVVDEGSMIDAELMTKLFSSIRKGSRLVLLGDQDQLPPVESGHFFVDLAKQQELIAPLKTCLRAELQEIVDLASSVKQGGCIPFKPLPSLHELVNIVIDRKIAVLTPLRKGPYGVENLNALIYQEQQKRGSYEIPIMIKVNDPTLGLYNGDLGTWNQRTRRGYFSEGRNFSEPQLPYYEYAYVISVHKSQGSEYDCVCILLPEGSEVFSREMLYTAITRAKKEVQIYAEKTVLEKILSSQVHRHSGLQQTLLTKNC